MKSEHIKGDKRTMTTTPMKTSLKDTLARAHALFLQADNPLSAEMTTLRATFLSPHRVEEFGDDELFLFFLENLIRNRDRMSFPEETSLYRSYFTDCIRLKNLEQSLPGYCADSYLADSLNMLDILKTPYYSSYFQTLIAMKSTFRETGIMNQTLKDFYGIMIKSPEDHLPLIPAIADQGLFYRSLPVEDEQVIRQLLLSTLALYTKADSSMEDLTAYLEREKEYFRTSSRADLWTIESLPELLAERTLYLDLSPSTGILRNSKSGSMSFQEINSEFLNHYAYNMNARSYLTNPAIGRDQEIEDLALILISPKKSPILLGEAGVGKTSVVEGLAYALQQGKAPSLLKDKKIFKLTTTSLLSGTKYVGEMEERMKKLMEELAKYPDVILFIDEIHTIVGAGSTESSNNDIANMLKPYIDRGDIKMIGATTSGEYHRFIKYDQALSRRFYPILVEEPGQELCLEIMEGSIPAISQATKVMNPFSREDTRRLLSILLDISTIENQPEDLKTRWPELPLSLLEMAFSYAALASRQSLQVEDFIHAVSHSNRLKNSVKKDAGKYFVL